MGVLADIGGQVATLLGGTLGEDVFLGFMPGTPDVCVAVYEPGGSAPTLGLGFDGLQFENPSIQVVVRGAAEDYATPRARAQVVFEGLPEIQAQTIGGKVYHLVVPKQSPFLMGRDSNKRCMIACNYQVTKEA